MVNTNCAVFGCTVSSFKNKGARFHQFPRSEGRCRRWLQACQRPDLARKSYESLKHKNICSRHFEKCMYGKRGLKKMAIPTLYLPTAKQRVYVKHNIESDVYVSSSYTQTQATTESSNKNDESCQVMLRPEEAGPSQFECDVMLSCDDSTQTLLLKRSSSSASQPKNVKIAKLDTKKNFMYNCDKYLPSNLSAIVKSQVDLKLPTKYTEKFKHLCLNMYTESPLAYKSLSKLLSLPSKLTLADMRAKKSRWELLAAAIKHMNQTERICVLCIDTMELEPKISYDSKADKIIGLHEVFGKQQPMAAEYAVTLMLQGICKKWELPVTFLLSSDLEVITLEKWLIYYSNYLSDLKFDVRAIVADSRTDFTKWLGISKDRSSFNVYGNEMKYMFDVLDLTNCMRNHLMEYNFEFEGKTARWEDIVKMYHLEKENDTPRLIIFNPKLNHSHIKPNKIQKTKYRYAAKVFNESVSLVMKNYQLSGALKDIDGTADFIETMSKLLDVLVYSHAQSVEEVLERVRILFRDLKVKNKIDNSDVTVKFLDNWIITFNSLERLMKGRNIQQLWINKINNSSLKSLFDLVRQVTGTRKPNSVQFAQVFRKHFLCKVMNFCDEFNKTNDVMKILENYTEFVKNNPVKETAQKERKLIKKQYYDIPEENPFNYICVYLMARCAKRHNSKCLASTASPENENPSDDFINYIQSLEADFSSDFYELLGPKIKQNLFERLRSIEFKNKPCECYPVEFLLKLYIKMRIFHIIQHNKGCNSGKETKIYLRVPACKLLVK